MRIEELAPAAVLEDSDGTRWLVDRRTWIQRGGDSDVAQLILGLVRVPDEPT